MDHDDLHYERFKTERGGQYDEQYAAWKAKRQPDIGDSETPADRAPRYESFLESFGRAIGEVITVPAGPDSVDRTPTETRDTPRRD